MLRTIVPGLARLGILTNPTNPMTPTLVRMLEAAGSTIHVKIDRILVSNPAEIAAAFSVMAANRPGALLVGGDSFILQQRAQIAESAARLGIPTIGSHVGYAEAAGLMSYGADPAESYRRAASLVDRILKGAKAADLPVEQPTKLQFVINRKTAKAIGVTVPSELLLLADRVIE
jgi:putative ABC transport system substrate-binding protein